MDIKRLRYFILVSELGSLSKAAEALNISQPALGLHIRSLEEELDNHLFIRHSRGVEMTPAGLELLPHAQRIVRDVENTTALLRAKKTGRGHVAVGVGPAIDPARSAKLIARVAEQFPQVSVNIVGGLSKNLVDWTRSGKLDLALVHWVDELPADVRAEPVLQEDIVLVTADDGAPYDEEIAFGTVARQPIILPPKPHSLRMMVEEVARKHFLDLDVRFELESSEVMLELAEHGIAGCVASRGALTAYPRMGKCRVQRIVEPHLVREMSLIQSTNRQPSHAASLVASLMAGAFAE